MRHKCSLLALFFGAAVAALPAGRAAAWEVRLNVEESWGQGGVRRVTGGVPLLAGQAKETSELRLARRGKGGARFAVPAQFRVLARWWREDDSIRWVLVDFTTKIAAAETQVFYLTDEKLGVPEPAARLTVEEKDDVLVIDTGPARFTLSRKKFALFQGAAVHGTELLEGSPDLGSVIEDTHGNRYYSSAGTKTVEVLERGPVRACVRARGMHAEREGKGYGPGMYGYDCFLYFYAGSSAVYVDYILTNNPPKSTGSPTFEDASLWLKLRGGITGYRIYGAAPLAGKLAEGESVCLYQDSNGAETWQRCGGYSGPGPGGHNFPPGTTVSFRGYKITRHAGGEEEELARGDRARGLTQVFNDKGGLVVLPKDFWQQFPKAVEAAADGRVRFGAFPRECKVPHFLEDASAKGHEFYLLFYKRTPERKEHVGYASGRDGTPVPHVFADCWDYPVLPRPEPAHIARTGALSDLGPFTVPAHGFSDYQLEVYHRRMLMPDLYWGNGYGWQVYGSRWRAFGGHSRRGARQPMQEDSFLYRWYVTGRRNWLVAGLRRSRHFRDVRCYRIEDQDPFGFKSWQEFRKANRSEEWTGRPQPKGGEIEKYSQGRYDRNTWWLPNPAHMTLDLLYDRYLLLGDVRAFENMKVIAGHGGNFSAYHKPYVHRQTGWSWRALERYWELTGEKDAEACLQDTLKNYSGMIGKAPLVCRSGGKTNWWFTQVHTRAAALTALHTRDKTALALLRTHAQGKEGRARYFCTLYAVLYHLTGEEKYKKLVLGDDDGAGLLSVGGQGDFPAAAHWLVTHPPKPIE